MEPTTHKTKVSEAGRGTYLIWQRVKVPSVLPRNPAVTPW